MADLAFAFLVLALVLYGTFGGADFGAGIWEALRGKHSRAHEELVTEALAPVWEANHVWLIIAVVILFTAFPAAFRQVVTTFHIPITAVLVGITLRGCAFTFRHYDAVQDPRSRRVYTLLFEIASLLTPFAIGTIAGGVVLGRIAAHPATYREAYIDPWLTPFGAVVGVFLVVLNAFVAAVFLACEAKDPATKQLFARRALSVNIAVVLLGLAVFVAAEASGLHLVARFVSEPLCAACMLAATALQFALHAAIKRRPLVARVLIGVEFALIIGGWTFLQYPALIAVSGLADGAITVAGAAAPEATLVQLNGALIVGSLLLLPALGYLLYVFKIKEVPQ